MARRGLLRLLLGCAVAAAVAASCHHPGGPDPCQDCGNGPPPGDVIFVGAGDIARCSDARSGRDLTANLISAMPVEAVIFTAGDNAYMDGTEDQFRTCYDSSWGRFKSRTHPVPGNHEYNTAGAAPYFNYFGAAAGPPGLGYYAFNINSAWRVLALNSEIAMDVNSPQMQFVKNDLQTNAHLCTIAIWHRPLFNSGDGNGEFLQTAPMFRALYDANAEIVINGHEHTYERFAPQDVDRHQDPARGLREFIVGTGGIDAFYHFPTVKPNSEARIAETFGVLKFVLSPTSYKWDFVPAVPGGLTDSGIGNCH
jgi:hypothetical protein